MTTFDDLYTLAVNYITDHDFEYYEDFDWKIMLEKAIVEYYPPPKDVDLNGVVDSTNSTFTIDLPLNIKAHLVDLMVVQWFNKQIDNEDFTKAQFSTKDYTAFSPANQLNALINARDSLLQNTEITTSREDLRYTINQYFGRT